MNVGAAIDKDADTFRKLKRVIIMGGSIKRGYGDVGFGTPTRRSPNGTSSTTYRRRKDSLPPECACTSCRSTPRN